jgi:hypothetical protein
VAKKFTDDIYKQMGVQVFMLVGYRNSEGDFVRSKYVSGSPVIYCTILISCQGGDGYIHANKDAIHASL